jgi:hypothetical protein
MIHEIKYEAGKLTLVSVKLGKVTFMIKTQQLVPDTIDGECSVSSAEVYNNLNKAMVTFNTALFRNDHKSFYSHHDIDILDECRTIVPCGLIKEVEEELIEIDISKAFTAALCDIKEIPIFNQFDIFKPYCNQCIKKLSLYIVKAKNSNLFFNKKYVWFMVCS